MTGRQPARMARVLRVEADARAQDQQIVAARQFGHIMQAWFHEAILCQVTVRWREGRDRISGTLLNWEPAAQARAPIGREDNDTTGQVLSE
jgi:hypothetical protein